jgi:hypothetical protein
LVNSMEHKKTHGARISYSESSEWAKSVTVNTQGLGFEDLKRAVGRAVAELRLEIKSSLGRSGKKDSFMEYDGSCRLLGHEGRFHLHIIIFQKGGRGQQSSTGMTIDVRPESGDLESGGALKAVVGAIERSLNPDTAAKTHVRLRE